MVNRREFNRREGNLSTADKSQQSRSQPSFECGTTPIDEEQRAQRGKLHEDISCKEEMLKIGRVVLNAMAA